MPAILAFYRNIAWISNFITVFGCYLIWQSHSWAFIVVVFWIKLCTNTLLSLYVHFFHADQYYFFQNLGFGKTALHGFTFMLDMLVWLILSMVTIIILL
jgi:hypothetical protein